MSSRTCLLLVPLFLPLASCVTFEKAPLPLTCDTRLEGRWLPIANDAEDAAKLTVDDYAVVDGQCHATLSMSQSADKRARKAELNASGFELGGEHYLALGEKDLAELFSGIDRASPGKTPGTSVALVRYLIEGDILKLETIDRETVKRMVDQHQFSAVTQDSLNYLIRGDDAQLRDVLLRHPALFGQGEAP
ncbi:MAG: hypothetical protein ABI538_08355, partial [Pseudoxanthomonas sp.]